MIQPSCHVLWLCVCACVCVCGFSSHASIMGEGLTNHSPTCIFCFVCFLMRRDQLLHTNFTVFRIRIKSFICASNFYQEIWFAVPK